MISPEKVRRDLKDIRYYYARKAILDSVKGDVGINKVRSMVDRYNKAMAEFDKITEPLENVNINGDGTVDGGNKVETAVRGRVITPR